MRASRSVPAVRRLIAVAVAVTAGVAATGAASAQAASFQTPTGNIGCYVLKDYARCDIVTRDWRGPKRPASCDLEWGDAIGISPKGRRGTFVCHGDTARDPHARKLAYGHSLSAGSMRCRSRTDGVRCTNNAGHGFFISRQSYRRF
jgi:hypothetical protein